MDYSFGQRPGFIENRGAACIDLFEDGGVLDDNPALRRQGDRADDGDGNGDEERAGGRHHQYAQEPRGLAAHQPCDDRDQ